MNFNQGWKFYRGSLPDDAKSIQYNDANWETVCLPHSVRLEPVMASGMVNYQGDAWYRKHFIVGKAYEGKKVFLKFEAAMHKAEVWLNNEKVTTHYGGYLPFTVDITEYVVYGEENVIAVKVCNKDDELIPPGKKQSELDFCYFGGLYRDVHMIVKNKIHITDPILANVIAGGGIFVTYENVSERAADLRVKVHISNQSGGKARLCLHFTLSDLDGIVLEDRDNQFTVDAGKSEHFEKTITVQSPKLWSPDSPNLYRLTAKVILNGAVVDTEELKIGIKSIAFTKDACFINGKRVVLTGVNRHQEYPYIGNALPDSLQYRDAKLIKNAGWNIVRTGHYPSDKAFLDACDELGILVIAPTPGWQFYPDKDREIFDKRSIQNVREMVRHTRNHACVGFWEPIINEEGRTPDSYRRATYTAVHEEYPGDQCYCAIDEEYDTEKLYDIIYKKTMENNPDKPGFTREFGDNWKEQYEGYEPKLYRVNRAKNAFGGFYRGGEADMLDNMLVRTIAQTANGEKTQLQRSLLGKYTSVKQGLDVGFCMWAGIDHNRGYCTNPAPVGALDFFRIPKYQYYSAMAQNLEGKPMVFIAANFDSRTVWIVSNCEKVRLYVDGILAGERHRDSSTPLPNMPFVFETNGAMPTELVAHGIIGGKVSAVHRVKKPSAPQRIRLVYDDMGVPLVADGSDKIMIYAYILDAEGNLCTEADNKILFEIEGEGIIVGDGNPRIAANPIRAQAGIAALLVESTLKAGEICVKADSKGLDGGRICFSSMPMREEIVPYIIPEWDNSRGRIVFEDEKMSTAVISLTKKNIALRKKASASSGNAMNGNDGNPATDWVADDWDKHPQWMVDLGEIAEINSVKVNWSVDSTTYQYTVSTKCQEEEPWTEQIHAIGTGQNSQEQSFAIKRARYVRISVLSVSSGRAAISECEIY